MTLEHVAIWTDKPEQLKDFYTKYFDGISNDKYTNEKKQFHSYFTLLSDKKILNKG